MLQQQIVAWLDRRREQYANKAADERIPSSIQLSVPVLTEINDSGYACDYETVETTPLAVSGYGTKLFDAIDLTAADIQSSPALALYETYGERCKVWSHKGYRGFQTDPPGWIYSALIRKVEHQYLYELSSLDTGNIELAHALVRDLLCLIECERLNVVTALPLAGIKLAEESIEVDNVRLRKIKPEELAQIADLWHRLPPRRCGALLPAFPRIALERSILEVRTPCDKRERPAATLLPHKVTLALQLLGFELNGAGSATVWTEPGPSLCDGSQRFLLANRGTIKECSGEQLQRALTLAHEIPDGAIRSPIDRQEVVLHRFLLGSVDDNCADKLIDYTIAMEGFLLPPTKEGEYRFKFSLYGAWYLALNQGERARLFKDLQGIYDSRSGIVHGSTPDSEKSILEKATTARNLSARLFIKGLEHEWPSHETLKGIALGFEPL